MEENKDYCFSEILVGEEPVTGVKLLTGEYKNIEYYYGHVKVVPEGGTHRLAFQFTIWDSAGHTQQELKTDKFINCLGDVLVALIADENQSGEYNGPTGSDDTEESDLS